MCEEVGSVSGFVDNYTQVGDIIAVTMCLLFALLLRLSFVSRTRSFLLFRMMLLMIGIAAYSNILVHVFMRTETAPLAVVTGLRIVHYSSMFGNLFLFLFYYLETMRVSAKKSRRILAVCAAVLVGLILYMIFGSILNLGTFRDTQNQDQVWVQLFNVGYLFFVAAAAVVAFRYRGRIYRQISLGVLGGSFIAVLLLIIQARHSQNSYTVASFLFPAVALLYLVHAKPYDLELGAIDVLGFDEHIRFCRRHGRELLLVSLLLPDFDNNEKKYPSDIQQQIRRFATSYFRRAVLFQVSNGRIIFAMETRRNPNYEETIRKTLSAFGELYEQYQMDHKIVIATTLASDEDINYVNLIRYVESRMPINSAHRVPQEDFDAYRRHRRIIRELMDIHASQDMNDPRVLVYCQPVLNLRTGKYDTAEALMRLQIDDLGLVPPNDFISLAEEHGYISTLSKIIFNKTCTAIRALLDEGYFVRRISINFSMIDLRDPDFSTLLTQIIREHSIPSEKVAIELTESQNERDFMLVKEKIAELHDSGVKFYLDDFGTGYSNFDRIMELPFDIIKFDRSLVIASGADAEKKTMVSHLAQMFNDTHYSILYEGVETDSDQERCTEMCARYLQGYKFSPPIPIERLRDYFEKTA